MDHQWYREISTQNGSDHRGIHLYCNTKKCKSAESATKIAGPSSIYFITNSDKKYDKTNSSQGGQKNKSELSVWLFCGTDVDTVNLKSVGSNINPSKGFHQFANCVKCDSKLGNAYPMLDGLDDPLKLRFKLTLWRKDKEEPQILLKGANGIELTESVIPNLKMESTNSGETANKSNVEAMTKVLTEMNIEECDQPFVNAITKSISQIKSAIAKLDIDNSDELWKQKLRKQSFQMLEDLLNTDNKAEMSELVKKELDKMKLKYKDYNFIDLYYCIFRYLKKKMLQSMLKRRDYD
eukprot:NODE_32_length_32166_cov_0.707737.p3 type:complete len:294 gc:universal NODE_32_length_32166_cov_0.707737:1792-2673(+)